MTRLQWYYSWFLPIFDLALNFKNFHKLEADNKVKEANLYISFTRTSIGSALPYFKVP